RWHRPWPGVAVIEGRRWFAGGPGGCRPLDCRPVPPLPTVDPPVKEAPGRGIRGRAASPPLAPHGGQMAPDPRTPVIVGVGQWSNRVDRGEDPVEPVDMMAEALRRAAADSGAGQAVLAAFDAVRVVRSLSHRYRDPGALV